jgi:predicted peptidase
MTKDLADASGSWRNPVKLLSLLLSLALLGLLATRVMADDKPSPGTQTPQKLDREVKVRYQLGYLLFLPESYEKADKLPLLIFLHGAGESGSDISLVKKHGPPKIVETKKDFPFIVVSPQSPSFGWRVEALNALLDDLQAKYKIDPDRVYLTGLSMGGFGTWSWAAANPERFAAIAPVCGGGNVRDAAKLKHIPTWVFHGAKDNVVVLQRSQEMVDALKKAGKEPKFTIYPEAGHDSWTETYDNPELYTWLLQQKRSTPERKPAK